MTIDPLQEQKGEQSLYISKLEIKITYKLWEIFLYALCITFL